MVPGNYYGKYCTWVSCALSVLGVIPMITWQQKFHIGVLGCKCRLTCRGGVRITPALEVGHLHSVLLLITYKKCDWKMGALSDIHGCQYQTSWVPGVINIRLSYIHEWSISDHRISISDQYQTVRYSWVINIRLSSSLGAYSNWNC